MMDIIHIFKTHYQYIYSYALKLTRNVSDAEDLTQETFTKAVEKLDQVKEEKAIKYWLRTICFKTYLMSIRKEKGIEISYDYSLDTLMLNQGIQLNNEDNLIVDETLKTIQATCFLTMVHRMKNEQRMIFSFVDMFGLSVKEVSSLLEITEAAVKSHLHRARKKLDTYLSNICGLLDVENPCRCEAWQAFVMNREKNKAMVRMYSYHDFDEVKTEVVEKLRQLFLEMPDYKPSNEWYIKVIKELNKMT